MNFMEDIFSENDSDKEEDEEQVGEEDDKSEQSILSKVVEISNIGGNRGLVATCYIPSCVLILAEVPAVTWKDKNLEEKNALITTIETCLSNELAYSTSKNLYPKSIEDCRKDEIDTLHELLTPIEITGIAIRSNIDRDEVLRVLLVLQHNGFGSGLYNVLTMLNHSCNPNCIKFSPSAGSSGASEVWTVREVQENEELTISYCEPLEMTKQSIQEYLELQHRFTCKCSDCIKENILRNSSSIEQQAKIEKIKVHENKLQDIIIGMEQEYLFLKNLNDIDIGFESVTLLMKSTTDLAAIESEETVSSSNSSNNGNSNNNSNNDSINTADINTTNTSTNIAITTENFAISPRILSRLYKISANCAALCLEYAEKNKVKHRKPKENIIKTAAFSFLRNSLCLLSYQLQYLDSDHPDIASSHIDIAEGLKCAFSIFPEDLITALSLPIDDSYIEFKLLNIHRNIPNDDNKKSFTVTKKSIKKEIDRFQIMGDRIKNLYLRRHFPSRLDSLKQGVGSCYWGNFIPIGHFNVILDSDVLIEG